jgi:LysR family transcriptional regulator, hypochlorite-specific transcription factor HypT
VKSRLIALNVHDAVLQLTEGSCDLLIAYHHASQPLQLSPDRYEMLELDRETLAAFSRPDADGAPLFPLPPLAGHRLPFLSYGSGAYLGRMVEQIVKRAPVPLALDAVCEADMAEALKAMALEGHGLAFLPASTVRRELRARRLVAAAAPGAFELTMEVRIYRARPQPQRSGKASAQVLWDFLLQSAA